MAEIEIFFQKVNVLEIVKNKQKWLINVSEESNRRNRDEKLDTGTELEAILDLFFVFPANMKSSKYIKF